MSGKTVLRLGFLYPDHSAEDDYPRMADLVVPAVEAEVVHTTISEDAHRVDAIRETANIDRLRAGARTLREKRIDAAMWACTCASFIFGLEGAKQQAAAIGEVVGAPASSTSLAFVEALRALGIVQVSIAASYPEDIAQLFKGFLAETGVTVVHLGSRGIVAGVDVAALSKDDTIRMVSDNDRPEAQAILVPDTALHTAGYVDDLQRAVYGKTVLTANQVTMWQALRLAGVEQPRSQDGLGSLFRGSSAR
jgi:maleate cis-trans isomerase